MNNDRLFKKTSIESLFTNDQPTNVFEEFKYIIYLSIHCIRCINILGEFENHQDLEFDSNMCILIDCDESEILLIEKLYKIPIPIFCLAYHKKYVKYLQNFTPPSNWHIKFSEFSRK